MTTLAEYQTRVIPAAHVAERVRAGAAYALRDKVKLRWVTPELVEVTAQQWVGVVEVPGIGPLRIVPKLAGSDLNVLAMVAVAEGNPPSFLKDLHRAYAVNAETALPELIARFLTTAAAQAHREGLLAGYRPASDDLTFVRGRLDVREQALRRFGRLDSLVCHFEEFDSDILENQLVTAALAVARTMGSDLRRRAASTRLLQDFYAASPTAPPDPSTGRARLRFDRGNERYRTVLTWALALLENTHINDAFAAGAGRAQSFLIDMNSLFERFVTALVRLSLPRGYNVRAQVSDSGLFASDRGTYTIRPDVVVSDGTRTCALDAKYKRYDTGPLAMSDLYQLTVYAQAHPGFSSSPRALLVHPALHPQRARHINFRPGGLRTAEVILLPLHLPAVLSSLTGGDPQPLATFTANLRAQLALDRPA